MCAAMSYFHFHFSTFGFVRKEQRASMINSNMNTVTCTAPVNIAVIKYCMY